MTCAGASGEGALGEAWASRGGLLRRKSGEDHDHARDVWRNDRRDFRGERRRNETLASCTDREGA
jgi:hypothetical protein